MSTGDVSGAPQKPKKQVSSWNPFAQTVEQEEETIEQASPGPESPKPGDKKSAWPSVPAQQGSTPGTSTIEDTADSDASVTVWNVVAGSILPEGSQLLDGTPVPQGSQLQVDGSVLLPDGTKLAAGEITLPGRVQLSTVLTTGGTVTVSSEELSGSIPSGTPLPSFGWPVGMKLPGGSQLQDGSQVPTGAEPQPDGSVLLPDGSTVPAENVTLPDGTALTDVTRPTGAASVKAELMPDGSKPSPERRWGWSTMQTLSPETVSSGTFSSGVLPDQVPCTIHSVMCIGVNQSHDCTSPFVL